MIDQRELITISRQMGSMMEAGVDILRVTRVLRAQTEDPESLAAFDRLDHDLKMGQSLADAMENVPTMFSPFAVSLVRQGEARNDIAGAFHKIADFLQKEDAADAAYATSVGAPSVPATVTPVVVSAAPELPVWLMDDLVHRIQLMALRALMFIAGLLVILAVAWGSVDAGLVERRWQNVLFYSIAALYVGGVSTLLYKRLDAVHTREIEQRKTPERETTTPVPSDASANADTKNVNIKSQEKPANGTLSASEGINPTREATFD